MPSANWPSAFYSVTDVLFDPLTPPQSNIHELPVFQAIDEGLPRDFTGYIGVHNAHQASWRFDFNCDGEAREPSDDIGFDSSGMVSHHRAP